MRAMQRLQPHADGLWVHAIVLLALALPYCIHLGTSSIWDANEAFYAETPREMLATGNYLSPQFNFEPRTQKPPFTYYVILISYKLFGVNEFAVRIPGALAAIGILLFSYATARRLFGPRAALMCAVISATSARVFILARRLPIDILLLFFLTGTLFFLVRAIQQKGRIHWAPVYLFAAFGFFTKGPIAAVIPAGAFLVWMLWRRQPRIPVYPLMGAAIFVCVLLPWYALAYRAHGWTYIAPFFLRDNFGRFAAEAMGPTRGFFYYVSVYASDFFPWSLLALAAFYRLWRIRKEAQPFRSLAFGLPLIWCLFVFFLFSFSKNKQEYYIAPLYPAAAVVLAGVLDRSASGRNSRSVRAERESPGSSLPGSATVRAPRQESSWWMWPYGFLAALLFMLSLFMPRILAIFMPRISLVLHFVPSLIFVAGSAWVLWSIVRRRIEQCFAALAVPLWTIFMIGVLFYIPALESFRPVKYFCRTLEAHLKADDEAGFFSTALPSMVYYLRRPIFQEYSHEQMVLRFQSDRRVFCILSEKDYDYFTNRGLKIYILDRHSRFAVRLATLLNEGYTPGEDLLLVTNRYLTQSSSSEDRSTS